MTTRFCQMLSWKVISLCVFNTALISQAGSLSEKRKLELEGSMIKLYFLSQEVVTWGCCLLITCQMVCVKLMPFSAERRERERIGSEKGEERRKKRETCVLFYRIHTSSKRWFLFEMSQCWREDRGWVIQILDTSSAPNALSIEVPGNCQDTAEHILEVP